jgi:hypothetical protein
MKAKSSFVTKILIIILILCAGSMAQTYPIDKGSKIISGQFSVSSYGGEYYERTGSGRLTRLELDPAASFFVGSGFALGFRLQFGLTARGSYNHTSWSIGPEFSYYYLLSEEKPEANGMLYGFLQAGYLYGNSSFGDNSDYNEQKIRLGTGLVHMLSNSIGLSAQLAYQIEFDETRVYFNPQDTETVESNEFGVYVGFLIFLY